MNETRAWFRIVLICDFAPASQETHLIYSTAPGAHIRP